MTNLQKKIFKMVFTNNSKSGFNGLFTVRIVIFLKLMVGNYGVYSREDFNKWLKSQDIRNVYFPMLIPKHFQKRRRTC